VKNSNGPVISNITVMACVVIKHWIKKGTKNINGYDEGEVLSKHTMIMHVRFIAKYD
jgi:hypothetical protein